MPLPDSALTQLTEETSPAGDTLIFAVINPTTTKDPRKIKQMNLIIEKIKESGGQVLSFGSVADGGLLKRSGANVVSVTSPSGEIVGTTDTQTLTNKRHTPRVTSESSSATPTINTDNSDVHRITSLATNITSFTTNLSGTPTHGQKLIIEILDNGTAQTITWGASFRANVDLPDTTTPNKLLRIGFMWDSVDSKWDCVAVSEEQ